MYSWYRENNCNNFGVQQFYSPLPTTVTAILPSESTTPAEIAGATTAIIKTETGYNDCFLILDNVASPNKVSP